MKQERERLNRLLISVGQAFGKELKLGIGNRLMIRQPPSQGDFTILFEGSHFSDVCSYIEGMLYGAAVINYKNLDRIHLLETAIRDILSVEKVWEKYSDGTAAFGLALDIAKTVPDIKEM